VYIYISVLILLSLAATFPLVRGYLRKKKIGVGSDAPVKRNKASSQRFKRNKASSQRLARQSAKTKSAPAKRARRSFKAASVHGRPGCCQGAKDLEGIRFLLDDLPTLPLDACDRLAYCQCSFTHHNDRREEERRNPRRAFSTAGADSGAEGINRRSGMGRRSGLGEELQDFKFD
jgi:hypothetical protein